MNNKNNSTKNGNKINNLKGINAEAQAIHNLHNKGKEYIKLMSKQKILRLVETLLKQSTFMNGEDIICQKSFARNPSFKKNKYYIQIVDLLVQQSH